jgi:hypothetical protein
MVNQQLLDYIKRQTQIGKSREEITAALLAAGWQAQDVEQAFTNPTPAIVDIPIPMGSELPKSRQILKEAWAIYKNRFKTLVIISLIPTVIYLLLILIIGDGQNPGIVDHAQLGSFGIAGIILGIVAAILIIYLYVWGSISALYAIRDQSLGWKEAYIQSQNKIGAYFFTGLLAGLATMGGFILLIVPGIIFGLWFSQSPYIVVEEGLKNTAALKRSKYYVKGRIGQIFGKLFYIGITTFALYIVLTIILEIFASVTGIKYNNLSWITSIFSLIWTPLITVYSYQVYKYCKSTRP